MAMHTTESLAELYQADETQWLESMAELIRKGRFDELDFENLQEYLADMGNRDRREVRSRLGLLIGHILKWTFQPDRRTGSWRATILVQQSALRDILESGTLRNHAATILPKAFANGLEQCMAETGMFEAELPRECPYSLEQLLALDLSESPSADPEATS